MVGVVSSSRAIWRVPNPSAASSTIRILSNCRCSVVAARSRDFNTARSFGFSRTSIASGIIWLLNHDAERDDSANVNKSLSDTGYSRDSSDRHSANPNDHIIFTLPPRQSIRSVVIVQRKRDREKSLHKSKSLFVTLFRYRTVFRYGDESGNAMLN